MRLASRPFLCRYLLALLLFNLSACSSMRPVGVESAMRGAATSEIDYGSLVDGRRLDGERFRFRVTEMTAEGIGGAPGFVRYEDMATLRVQAQSEAKALGWVVGVLGVVALLALAGSADEVRVCNPGPCNAND